MQLYRFSPIDSKEKLLEAIGYVHAACFELCKKVLGSYSPTTGHLGIFCHYDNEYELLIQIRKEMTDESDTINQKYYRLHEPIVMAPKDGIPETIYTHLYIRKPDPYRSQVGDTDFILEAQKYKELKNAPVKGARLFERPDTDMIELHNPDFDVLAYIVTK